MDARVPVRELSEAALTQGSADRARGPSHVPPASPTVDTLRRSGSMSPRALELGPRAADDHEIVRRRPVGSSRFFVDDEFDVESRSLPVRPSVLRVVAVLRRWALLNNNDNAYGDTQGTTRESQAGAGRDLAGPRLRRSRERVRLDDAHRDLLEARGSAKDEGKPPLAGQGPAGASAYAPGGARRARRLEAQVLAVTGREPSAGNEQETKGLPKEAGRAREPGDAACDRLSKEIDCGRDLGTSDGTRRDDLLYSTPPLAEHVARLTPPGRPSAFSCQRTESVFQHRTDRHSGGVL